jgi:predicted RND superfamily exporter protein
MDAAPVTGMTLGLLVDDTTHNMIKYLHARREMGLSPADAVRYTFSTVGMATMTITLTLLAGFGVLAFSAFKFNATMGFLSAAIIAVGGAIEFLLMPPLLLKLEEHEHEQAMALAADPAADPQSA